MLPKSCSIRLIVSHQIKLKRQHFAIQQLRRLLLCKFEILFSPFPNQYTWSYTGDSVHVKLFSVLWWDFCQVFSVLTCAKTYYSKVFASKPSTLNDHKPLVKLISSLHTIHPNQINFHKCLKSSVNVIIFD